MTLAKVVPEAKIDHRFLTGHDSSDVALVTVKDHQSQDSGDQRQDPIMFAQGDDEDGRDSDNAGNAGHAGQQESADKDQAGDPEKRRVVSQQDPSTSGDGFAPMEVVKDGDGVAQGGEDPDQKGVDAGTNSPEVRLAGSQGPL